MYILYNFKFHNFKYIILQFFQFYVGTILHFCFTSEIDIRNISAAFGGCIFDIFFGFSQNRALSVNLNINLKCK